MPQQIVCTPTYSEDGSVINLTVMTSDASPIKSEELAELLRLFADTLLGPHPAPN